MITLGESLKKMRKKENKVEKNIKLIMVGLLNLFLIPALVMWIWNWQMIQIGLPIITYWNAFWLSIIFSLLSPSRKNNETTK